jgi:hypothetical protein
VTDGAPQNVGDDLSTTCDVYKCCLGIDCDVLQMGLASYDPADSRPCLLAAGRTMDAPPVRRRQISSRHLVGRSTSRLWSQAWAGAKAPPLSGLTPCPWAVAIGVGGGECRSHCDNLRHAGRRVSFLPCRV